MRTFEEREGECNRQLEIETLSKICNEAEDMNSEVKKLIGCYVVNGVMWEMRKVCMIVEMSKKII